MTEENLDPWSNGTYTDEQLGKLSLAIRNLDQTGNPQESVKVKLQMEALTPYEDMIIPNSESGGRRGAIRPETTIEPSLVDEPPRTGKGSGHKKWMEFAGLVSDIDEEVLDSFSRDEIVQILIDRDIIDIIDSE